MDEHLQDQKYLSVLFFPQSINNIEKFFHNQWPKSGVHKISHGPPGPHLRRFAFTETHGFAGIAGLPWLDVAVSGDPMVMMVDGFQGTLLGTKN